jgi:flagellar assembly factor FliW
VLITSEHLGDVDVAEENVIEFPDGLLGFPECTRFALISAEESGVYAWLQSTDQAELSFLVVVPAPFFPDYEPEISEADCAALELVEPADAQILCLVTIQTTLVTANLLGPVVLNVANRRARQVVLTDTELSTAEPIVPSR